MFFKAFEIERRSFSTDYMEWNLRSSARLRSAMIVNESDEARPRHRDEQPDQDPGHRRFHFRYKKVGQPPCSTPISAVHWIERTPARENHLFEGPAGGADPSTGGTDNPRRGEGPRRGRRQGGASRAPRLSSARSATTRRRARSRRRRSSARQRTGRPLVK